MGTEKQNAVRIYEQKGVFFMTKLQAHRGVSSEAPENTLPAITLAIAQQYAAIELDPIVTRDLQVVLHHDATVNRTGRNADGSPIDQELRIDALTLEELNAYDFGIHKHPKYQGTRLPLLAQVLPLARQAGVQLKLDAKLLQLSPAHQAVIFDLIRDWQDVCGLSTKTPEQTLEMAARFPEARIHYGGKCTQQILETLSEAVGKDRLWLWVPYPNMRSCYAFGGTQGIKPQILPVDPLTPELARRVKKYGHLGVFNLAEEAEFDACKRMGAELCETNGEVKPVQNLGVLSDMHTHCDHSHDAKYPMPKVYESCRSHGIKIMAAADHYDGAFCADGPYDWSHIRASNEEADALTAQYGGDGMVLRSIELGEPQWDPEATRRVIEGSKFDSIVGAIHAVKSPMFEGKQLLQRCFSQLKYDELTARQIYDLLDAYYRDNLEMVRTMDIDICAHLTCVVGYFMSRHKIFVGVEQFKEQIRAILQELIDRGIALEVNFGRYPDTGITSPHQWIIQLYRDMGGYLICMATDTHSPAGAGKGYEAGIQLLKDMGFRHIFYFKDRMPVPCTLL